MNKDFVCRQCGECCFESPCVFARVNYEIEKGDICPDLIKTHEKYECSLIKRDVKAREVLLGNGCDHSSKRHLKPKFDPMEIVREYFPDITEEEAESLIWEETSYPEFWNIPEDGWTPSECLRTQIERLKSKNKEK